MNKLPNVIDLETTITFIYLLVNPSMQFRIILPGGSFIHYDSVQNYEDNPWRRGIHNAIVDNVKIVDDVATIIIKDTSSNQASVTEQKVRNQE